MRNEDGTTPPAVPGVHAVARAPRCVSVTSTHAAQRRGDPQPVVGERARVEAHEQVDLGRASAASASRCASRSGLPDSSEASISTTHARVARCPRGRRATTPEQRGEQRVAVVGDAARVERGRRGAPARTGLEPLAPRRRGRAACRGGRRARRCPPRRRSPARRRRASGVRPSSRRTSTVAPREPERRGPRRRTAPSRGRGGRSRPSPASKFGREAGDGRVLLERRERGRDERLLAAPVAAPHDPTGQRGGREERASSTARQQYHATALRCGRNGSPSSCERPSARRARRRRAGASSPRARRSRRSARRRRGPSAEMQNMCAVHAPMPRTRGERPRSPRRRLRRPSVAKSSVPSSVLVDEVEQRPSLRSAHAARRERVVAGAKSPSAVIGSPAASTHPAVDGRGRRAGELLVQDRRRERAEPLRDGRRARRSAAGRGAAMTAANARSRRRSARGDVSRGVRAMPAGTYQGLLPRVARVPRTAPLAAARRRSPPRSLLGRARRCRSCWWASRARRGRDRSRCRTRSRIGRALRRSRRSRCCSSATRWPGRWASGSASSRRPTTSGSPTRACRAARCRWTAASSSPTSSTAAGPAVRRWTARGASSPRGGRGSTRSAPTSSSTSRGRDLLNQQVHGTGRTSGAARSTRGTPRGSRAGINVLALARRARRAHDRARVRRADAATPRPPTTPRARASRTPGAAATPRRLGRRAVASVYASASSSPRASRTAPSRRGRAAALRRRRPPHDRGRRRRGRGPLPEAVGARRRPPRRRAAAAGVVPGAVPEHRRRAWYATRLACERSRAGRATGCSPGGRWPSATSCSRSRAHRARRGRRAGRGGAPRSRRGAGRVRDGRRSAKRSRRCRGTAVAGQDRGAVAVEDERGERAEPVELDGGAQRDPRAGGDLVELVAKRGARQRQQQLEVGERVERRSGRSRA